MPLVPIAVMPFIGFLSGLVLPVAFAICVIFIWRTHVLQRGAVAKYVTPIATVLRLTTQDEYVMDLKGDAIYRQRPIYFAIETFAKLRMKLGWIKNDIVERLIQTRTPVCFHPPFPGAGTMKFVNANYLPLASTPNVLVLGKSLPAPSGGIIHFTVSIPAEYVLLEQGHPARGALDGRPYTSAINLNAGDHQFASAGTAPVTLFWARARDQGYRSLH